MRLTDQYIWNIVFGLLFIGLVAFAVYWLDEQIMISRASLSVFDIFLITLAAFRLTRLFGYDTITKWFREQFWDSRIDESGQLELVKPENGPRRTLADLMSCPWCLGLWFSSTVAFFYLLTPLAYFPTLIFAIAGLASLLQVLANLIGWKAELAKQAAGGDQ